MRESCRSSPSNSWCNDTVGHSCMPRDPWPECSELFPFHHSPEFGIQVRFSDRNVNNAYLKVAFADKNDAVHSKHAVWKLCWIQTVYFELLWLNALHFWAIILEILQNVHDKTKRHDLHDEAQTKKTFLPQTDPRRLVIHERGHLCFLTRNWW